MTDRLKNIELRYAQIEARLAANETYADPELVSRLNREQRELEPLATAYRSLLKAKQGMEDAQALLSALRDRIPCAAQVGYVEAKREDCSIVVKP